MPHRHDVERSAELETFGLPRQVDAQKDEVGEALIPFPLKVVLRRPQAVKAQAVNMFGQCDRVVVSLD
jgi:hypothetical protein